MATVYWWNDGVISSAWDNLDNWWSDLAHTTPNGSQPLTGDLVYFVGPYMPSAVPGSAVTLHTFDTASYGGAGPWYGFDTAAVTANITVSNSLTFGTNGDAAVASVWGGASEGASTFYGSTINHGVLGLSGVAVAVDFNDSTLQESPGTVVGNAGAVNFNDTASCEDGVSLSGSGEVTFNDSAEFAGTLSASAMSVSNTASVTGGNITVTTLVVAGGTVEALTSLTISATNITHTGGKIISGTITVGSGWTINGVTAQVGSDDSVSGPSVTFTGSADLTLASGSILAMTSSGIDTFTQTAGTINGDAGSNVSIVCVTAVLTLGTLFSGTVNHTGAVTVGVGYQIGSGGGISGGSGVVTVDSQGSLTSGNIGVAGGTTIIKGKLPTTTAYIKQTGIPQFPDFTRGKNPFGGGVFS